MYHRQTTPPSASFNYIPGSVGSSIDGTFYNSSPESTITANTTPPRSPIRQHGPLLLPKVRAQDQVSEPSVGPVRHRRTTSSSSIGYAAAFNPYARPSGMVRRGSSPFNHSINGSSIASPASTTSSYDFGLATSTLNSPISFQPEVRRSSLASHSRSRSATGVRGHSRAGSAGSIDENVISRYGFPTYRNLPSYVTSSSAGPSSLHYVSSMPTELPTDFSSSFSSVQELSQYATTADFTIPDFEPAPAVQYPVGFDTTTTSSLLDYLTAPNPSPDLVRRVTSPSRGLPHYWWDIRNLRSWSDFNVSTITSLPSVLPLLQIAVESYRLPEPQRANHPPETESQLQDIYANFYGTKINAALEVAQGSKHMLMRSCKPQPGSRQQTDFVSNYPSDYDKTIFGETRGRVVGLVKSYDQWNTGMRSQDPTKKILYLKGLAHLHHSMRENNCRYGFIMTEIELLCVRCGGPSSISTPDPTIVNASTSTPLFGYLELSPPISLATHSLSASTGDIQMTAGLALWYLHMLAREDGWEGMGTWRMEVGGPAALTRRNCLERDEWVPKPHVSEKREAKRVRGWVWPEEPLSKRECGRGKRRVSLG